MDRTGWILWIILIIIIALACIFGGEEEDIKPVQIKEEIIQDGRQYNRAMPRECMAPNWKDNPECWYVENRRNPKHWKPLKDTKPAQVRITMTGG